MGRTNEAGRRAGQNRLRSTSYALLVGLTLLDCRSNPANPNTIHIDGSSAVFPLTEVVVEEYGKQHSDQKITVGISGTGGGFQKFCRDDVQIADASRPITASERSQCGQNNVWFLSLAVPLDWPLS